MRMFGKGLVVAATVATALCAAGLVQARSERPARTLDVAPLTVTLAPASASNLIGTQHTVTATVTDSGAAPVVGASVTFTVTGANPTNDTETTDTNGIASFSYTGTVPGDDTIGAQAVVLSGADVVAQGDATPVTKTWTSGLSISKTASGVRSVATTYTWSVSKSTSTSSLSLRPGESASGRYTINATRTQSGSTTSDDVSGSISIANASTVDQQVVLVDQVRTADTAAARGDPFSTTTTVPANGSVTVPYDIVFAEPPTDTGSYTNHVDVLATPSGPVLASADAAVSFVTNQTTAGATADVSDTATCPAEFTCGDPQNVSASENFTGASSGATLGTATGTTAISYTRLIANNSLCASQGNAAQDATTSKDVSNTATVTPGDNSLQPAQASNQVAVTVSGGQCLTAANDTSTALTNTRTYAYTLQKKADRATVTLVAGKLLPQPLTYTLTATRTLSGTSARVAGKITVTNNSAAATSGLTIVDTVSCPGATGGTQTITPAAALGAGLTQSYPYDITFVPGATTRTLTTDCTNSVAVTASANSATATIHFALPAQNALNPTGTITDTVTQCPTGLNCTVIGNPFKTTDADSTQTFHAIVTVRNVSFCGQGTVINQARLVDSLGTSFPTQSASVTVTGSCPGPAGSADLSLSKTAPASVAKGARFSWQLVVRNGGPSVATIVILTDTLPSATPFVSATPSQGTCSGATTVGCALGTLDVGKTATVTITVNAPAAAGAVTNTASVVGKELDPSPANNVASSTVTVGSGSGPGPGPGPGPAPGPPSECRLKVTAPGFYVGIRTTVTVTATHSDGTPIAGSAIKLDGTGGIKDQSTATDSDGKASFTVHPTKPGAKFTVSSDGCDPKTFRSRPSLDCSGVGVSPKSLVTWQWTMMTITLRLLAQPVTKAKVVVTGAGINASGITNDAGRVRLKVIARKRGIFKISAPGALACSKQSGAAPRR